MQFQSVIHGLPEQEGWYPVIIEQDLDNYYTCSFFDGVEFLDEGIEYYINQVYHSAGEAHQVSLDMEPF